MGQEGEKYILSLRRHIITTPRYEVTITLSIIFTLLSSYLIYWDIWKALLIFGVPYALVNFLDYAMIKIGRTYFPGKRILTLNLLIFIEVLIQILIFQRFFSFEFSLLLAFSSAVFLRTFVYFVFMRKRPVLGIITSLNYNMIYGVIALFAARNFTISYTIASGIYLISSLFILRISVAKFVREFSEDPLWFIASFINYLSNGEREHLRSINRFFENIYTERTVPVSSMVFWKGDTPRVIFLFPYIHPGPFGEVGGSDITKKLKKFTGFDNLMIFHTTTTHDNNVADERDVKKIANVVKNSINAKNRCRKMSDALRFEFGNLEVLAHLFGRYLLVALLPTRDIFDDVDLKAGLMLRKKLLNFYDDAAIVDAHNNFDENAFPLTLTHGDVDAIAKRIKNLEADAPIVMGYAQRSFKGKSFGPDGIKVAVFIHNGKRIGYILLDGNNVKKGLRSKIIESLGDVLDEIEVFSTDNHIVNYNIMDLNPVGDKDDWNEIIKMVKDAVNDALSNAEEVEVSMHTEMVKLRMARRGQLEEMTNITKSAINTIKFAMPLIMVGGFLGALLSFLCI